MSWSNVVLILGLGFLLTVLISIIVPVLVFAHIENQGLKMANLVFSENYAYPQTETNSAH